MFRSFNKTQKIIIGAVGGVALCGLLVLLGFAGVRALTTAAVAEPGTTDLFGTAIRTTPGPTTKAMTLRVDFSSPSNAPAPVLTYRADETAPLPEDGYVHALGEPFALSGTVYSNYPITAVSVSISCAHNSDKFYPYRASVRFSDGTSIYRLSDPRTDSGKSLAETVDFSKLSVGVHTLKITASCEGARSVELFRWKFYVAGPEWEQITRENFPDSYPEALKFFGDTAKFLYRYQWVNGRYIMADPEWEKTYITQITAYPNGELWNVHVDAVPYFTQAFDYLDTSYFRVSGTNGDTGVIPASNLITEYNGCYVSRFTSSLKAISHHTFGTAVDVNASMEPNKNVVENTAVIDDDVKGHLTYNGLKKNNGITYYDFTYDGEYPLDPNGVPQTCVNYILFELGFFRAGFNWAHYYKSTSDGMHFCLSEYVTYSHDDKEMGLRKVTVYAEPQRPTSEQAHAAALSTAEPTPTPDATPTPEITATPAATAAPSAKPEF